MALSAFLVCAALAAEVSEPSVSGRNEESVAADVLSYTMRQLGRPVGDGECASLVRAALDFARAKPLGTWADSPSPGDLVWGRLTGTMTPERVPRLGELDVRPGDVLQMRSVSIRSRRGYVVETITAARHTAVVEEVSRERGEVRLLHQNSQGRRMVTRDVYPLRGLREGTIWVYRPQPQ